MRQIEPTDFVGTSPVWVLDLHFAGQVFRVATEPVNVRATDGSMHSYLGGLQVPEFEESLGRLKFTAPEASATVRVVLPVSVAQLRRRGHDWLSAHAALYLTAVRDADRRLTVPTSILDHDELWHLVDGPVHSPSYADPALPPGAVEFTVEVAPWQNQTPVLEGGYELSAGRWPNIDQECIGRRAPLVIGQPGSYRAADGTAAIGAGSPAYVVQRSSTGSTEKVLIAGHPRTIGQGAGVTIIDEDGLSYATTATLEADGLGTIVTVADITGGAGSISRADRQYYCAWTTAGGLASDLSAGFLEDAVEVVAYFLLRAGLAIDAPAWQAIRGQVPKLRVATYINDDVSAWDFVSSHVLPLLPIGLRFTRQGLAPVLYEPLRRRDRAVAHVRVRSTPDFGGSGDWTPISGLTLETERDDVPQQLTVHLASDVRTSSPARTIQWQGTGAGSLQRYAGPVSVRNRSGSLYLDHAATRGARARHEIQLAAVWDPDTAASVALRKARQETMPTESAAYLAPYHWGWLRCGDDLLVDDASKAMESQPAIIESRTQLPDGQWEFGLVFDEDPVRDPREVS